MREPTEAAGVGAHVTGGHGALAEAGMVRGVTGDHGGLAGMVRGVTGGHGGLAGLCAG